MEETSREAIKEGPYSTKDQNALDIMWASKTNRGAFLHIQQPVRTRLIW